MTYSRQSVSTSSRLKDKDVVITLMGSFDSALIYLYVVEVNLTPARVLPLLYYLTHQFTMDYQSIPSL